MSSHETPDPKRRGPSGMTTLELAALLPPLEPLPLPPLVDLEPPPTLWRVLPRLLFSIAFGTLAVMHVGIFLMREDEPLKNGKCLELANTVGVFAITAVLCALAGAGLLAKFRQALRNRRLVRSPAPG
jgi:hypothetical protein